MNKESKASFLCIALSLAVCSGAAAQEIEEGAPGNGAAIEATCSALTPYGEAQHTAATSPPALPANSTPAAAFSRRRGTGARTPRAISIPTAPILNYAPVELPQPPAGTEFGNIAGIGLLSNGHLIIYQRKPQNQLLEYDSGNRLLRSFDENIAARPHSLRVDKYDNIWITDVACNTVMKLSPAGDVLMTLGTRGKSGTWDEASGTHLFNQPTDLGFGPNGDIFVSTGHGGPDPRIIRFDKNGKFITTWSLKHPDGSTANIHTMMVDGRGTVYAGDREVMKIYVYDADGRHLRDIQMPNLVCGFYIDKKGDLWMSAGQDGMLMRLDWSGRILGWTGKVGKGPNEYGEAHYMVVTPDQKTIYVADTVNNHVMKLQATH